MAKTFTAEQVACFEYEQSRFRFQHGREMTAGDVFFADEFRKGYVSCDEPPGFEERYYQLWLFLGGVVDAPRVVTVDDL